jgi:hypothetical protein
LSQLPSVTISFNIKPGVSLGDAVTAVEKAAKEEKVMAQVSKEVKSGSCGDENCPFHGSLSTRGMTLTGKVVSDKMHKTVVVQIDYLQYFSKYKRYAKRDPRSMPTTRHALRRPRGPW